MLPVGNKHLISCSTCDHCQYTLPGQKEHFVGAPLALITAGIHRGFYNLLSQHLVPSSVALTFHQDPGWMIVGPKPSPAHPRGSQRWLRSGLCGDSNVSQFEPHESWHCQLGICHQRIKKNSFDWITCSISPFRYSAGLILWHSSFFKSLKPFSPNNLPD